MKRLLIGAIVLAAVAAPLVSTNSSAAGLKLKKPGKIDPVLMVVSGGLPYPLGLTCGASDDECTADHGFGHMTIAFPKPVDAGNHVDLFTATCTPKYALAPTSTDFPTAAITKTFGPMTANYADTPTLRTQGYSLTGSTITLMMPKYDDPATSGAGAQTPPLSCQITSTNSTLLHPGVYPGGGGGTVASKAPKLTSSPSSDCAGIANAGYTGFPDAQPELMLPPTFETGVTTLHLNVQIKVSETVQFEYCSTDASYRAKFLTEQATNISAGTKVAYKAAKVKNGVETAPAVRLAFVKKLKLTSPVQSSIPLVVSGSKITYRFDPNKLQVVGGSAGCIMKAPKVAGAVNACVVNNTTGTITLNSSDSLTIKVGKPIVSATTDIAFSWVNTPETTSSISLESASTGIQVGTVGVNVDLKPFGIVFGLPDDLNIGAPAVTLSGLL